MEFIGIGDLHLTGTNNHGGFSRFVDDSDSYIMSEVQRVVDYGVENGISKFIVYGDICDTTRMSYNAHIALNSFFTKNKNCNFYLILGNHDKFAVDSNLGHSCNLVSLFQLENVNIYENTAIEVFDDCKVNFLSYPFADFKKGMLNVCHLDLNGGTMDNGSKIENGIDPKRYHIVSGHIHSSSQFHNCYYSGTLYQTKFGEDIMRKGFHVIECCGKDVEVRYVPFKPQYELQTLVVDSEKSLLAQINSLKKKNVFYRILQPASVDIDPAIYTNLNVVEKKCFESKKQLKQLEEFKLEFEELNLNVEPVLNRILDAQYPDMKNAILRVRAEILAKQ